MRKFFLITAAASVAGVASLFLGACSRSEADVPEATKEIASTVAVAKTSTDDLSRSVVLTGEFIPYQEIDVMAKVAGFVKNINVDIGDRVKQGQLLAVLEVPEMNDDITRAKAAVERSSSEVQRARDELRRAESAHEMSHLGYSRLSTVSQSKPGLVAQQEIDDARSRDLVAEAQVSAARSALAAAENQVKESQSSLDRFKTLYNYTRVTAPFSGVVTRRFADTGSMIQAGTASQTQAMPLIRLSQNQLLRLILPVPESVVPQIRDGATVEVRVPSLKRTFPGKVTRFADKVDTSTRTMSTEVDVPNPSLVLVPGMYAEVDLSLEKRNHVLAVPVTALAGTESHPVVYLVNPEGKIEVRPISVGLQGSNRVEIRSGLQKGDLVVIANRGQLKPGQRVIPRLTELVAEEKEQ